MTQEVDFQALTMRGYEMLPFIDPEGSAKSWVYEGKVIVIQWPCSDDGVVIAHWEGTVIEGDFGYYRVGPVRNCITISSTLMIPRPRDPRELN